MPWVLILIVAGLVLVFATSYVTLGWILVGLGVALSVVMWLFVALLIGAATKQTKKYKKFGGW
jgi:hypothetical protein